MSEHGDKNLILRVPCGVISEDYLEVHGERLGNRRVLVVGVRDDDHLRRIELNLEDPDQAESCRKLGAFLLTADRLWGPDKKKKTSS